MDSREIRRMAELEDRHWWFTGSRRILLSVLAGDLSPGSRILDVGCGTGLTLSMLARHRAVQVEEARPVRSEGSGGGAWWLRRKARHGSALLPPPLFFGLDCSSDALRLARSKCSAALVQGSVGHLPFAAASFEAVLCLDVLEHMQDDAAAVGELARVLRPGGLLLASVPAHPRLYSTHDRALGHVRRYTRKGFLDLLAGSGLAVRRHSYYNLLLAAPIAAVRYLRKLVPGRPDRDSDLSLPPRPINSILAAIFGAESRLAPHLSLPAGISLFALAEKERI
jgi:ubiquinone/menaquinone biosynthesis C-methylase UbiE